MCTIGVAIATFLIAARQPEVSEPDPYIMTTTSDPISESETGNENDEETPLLRGRSRTGVQMSSTPEGV